MSDPDRPTTFRLSAKAHRQLLRRGVVLVQPPKPEEQHAVRELAAQLAAGRSEGIPNDRLFVLEALRQLAEQGNQVAQWLYARERAEMGIDVRYVSMRTRAGSL